MKIKLFFSLENNKIVTKVLLAEVIDHRVLFFFFFNLAFSRSCILWSFLKASTVNVVTLNGLLASFSYKILDKEQCTCLINSS